MKNKILVVIDMQNDFLVGSLANSSAVKVIPLIKKEIESGDYTHIIFTQDTHDENYLNTQEGKLLPVIHCVKGETGWKVCNELIPTSSIPTFYLEKSTFGYSDWKTYIKELGLDGNDSSFTFTGTCTDICVVSNVLAVKAAFPEAKVRCIENCCAPLFGDSIRQEAAIMVMKSCQVEICSK